MDRIFEDITTVNRNVREKGMLLTKVSYVKRYERYNMFINGIT